MRQPYPEIEPDASGALDVGDGHRIHWEACGARGGKPAVVLHGGPGSGCGPWPDPRYDDPAFRLCFARLVTHYWRHAAWLDDGVLLR